MLDFIVAEYWRQQLSVMERKKSIVEQDSSIEMLPSGRAAINARLTLADGAFLDVHETIELVDGVPRRVKYSYHLQSQGGDFIKRWDRDPRLDEEMEYHINLPGSTHQETHVTAERVTITQVADEAWHAYCDWLDQRGDLDVLSDQDAAEQGD